MNDSNEEQLVINTNRTKSFEAVQTGKSCNPGEPLHSTASITQGKRRYSVRLIALMSLGAIAVIAYVPRSALGQSYGGLAVALCVVASGVFLVRRFILVLTEEDKLQEKQLNANQAAALSSQPNPAGLQTNLTSPPPEAGENVKYRKA